MRLKRLIVSAVAAVALAVIPAGMTGAWTSDCSTNYKWCIYRDDNWALPVAAMNGDLDNYNNGAKYPNTESLINDSANGSKNWYSNYAVNTYNDAYDQSYSMCTAELTGWKTIGFFNNDRWSSHLRVSVNAC